MSTTPSGTITASDVRTALNVTNSAGGSTNYPTNFISFNDPLVRRLAGKTVASSSISMNDMRNKAGPEPYGTAVDFGACGVVSSSTFSQNFNNGTYGTYRVDTTNSPFCRVTLTTGDSNITSNKADHVINVSLLPGYIAGKSDIIITINPGIYVYATSTTNAGLTVNGGQAGDVITIINYGYIMGKGGSGGLSSISVGNPGGPAISLGWHATIDNTSADAYIGGGGGGGGSYSPGFGGGGAGGGKGGSPDNLVGTVYVGSGGVGGAPGQIGGTPTSFGNGIKPTGGGAGGGGGGVDYIGQGTTRPMMGAGGGRIFPGTGGAAGYYKPVSGPAPVEWTGGAGGAANNPGQSPDWRAGGGGGWGASGGAGTDGTVPKATGAKTPGGAGGKAVQLNGYTVTWVNNNTTRVYGAVS